MLALDCSHSAAKKWIEQNDDNLTKAAALEALAVEFKVPANDLLTHSTIKQ